MNSSKAAGNAPPYGAVMRHVNLLSLVALAACATTAPPARTRAMLDSNKQLVRMLYADINANRIDRLADLIGPEYPGPRGVRGPESFREVIQAHHTGFPDIVYTLDELLAEGDRVAVRWTWRGTHTGSFRTFTASGKRVVNSGFAVFHIKGGKIVDGVLDTDRLGFLVSVGHIAHDPAFGPPPPTE